MNHIETFQKNLRTLIDNRGMTALDACLSVGVSNATMSRYLNGLRVPDTECLIKISLFFGVSIDWLLGISDSILPVRPDEAVKMYEKYKIASPTDKGLIDTILSRYEVPDDNQTDN